MGQPTVSYPVLLRAEAEVDVAVDLSLAAELAEGEVLVPGGPQSLRAVRPVGATVTAATSPFVLVQVPDPAGEGPGASD